MANRGGRIIVGFFLRNIYMVLNIVLSFFMMPFILHTLGDRMYGMWVLMGAFMGYMGYLDFGITAAVSRLISGAIGKKDYTEVNEIINTSFVIYLVLCAVTILITFGLIAGAGIFVKDPEDLRIVRFLLFCIGLNLATSFPVRAFGGVIGSHMKYHISESILVAELIVRNLLILIFFHLGFRILALGAIVAGVAIGTSLLNLYFAFAIDKNIYLSRRLVKKDKVRQILSYSTYSFVSRIAGIFTERIDSFIITIFLGLSFVAHYSIASVLMAYLGNFLYRSVELVGPVFSQEHGRKDDDSIRQKFLIVFKITIYLVTFFGFMAILYGRSFIARWTGPQYLDAYPVLLVLALASIVSNIQLPGGIVLFNISQHKFTAFCSVAEGLVKLTFSILLVKYIGMVGVAAGSLASMLVIRFFVQSRYLCHVLGINLSTYYCKYVLRNFLLAMGVILPVFYSLRFMDRPDYISLFGVGFIQLAIYLVIVVFVGFDKYERKYFLGFIRQKAPVLV